MTYTQRKVAEFKEIQKESYMTATPKPFLLQPEAVAWYEEILIETIAQALAEEREKVRERLIIAYRNGIIDGKKGIDCEDLVIKIALSHP